MSGAGCLEACGLRLRLGGRAILDGIDCRVEPGLMLAILGPNGAGKTTLVRTLAGLLAPSGGRVSIGGRPLAGLARRERAHTLSYLPQNGGVFWPLPVEAVVGLGRLPHGGAPDALTGADYAAVVRAMRTTDVEAFAGRPVTSLSGGERARVMLARALAVEAPVLLCDEPVAALDPRHQLLVMARLREEARAGRAVAVVMHDLALAARFADRVLILSAGRVRAGGSPRDILTAALLAEAFGVDAIAEERPDGLLVLPWRLA